MTLGVKIKVTVFDVQYAKNGNSYGVGLIEGYIQHPSASL